MLPLVANEIDTRVPRGDALLVDDLRQELAQAADMQRRLLPPPALVTKLGIAAKSLPARAVGGDFYEVIPYPGTQKLAVAIGDVTGKGVSAAIYGAMVAGIVRTLAQNEPSPAEMLRDLNNTLLRRPVRACFVSLIYAMWDERKRHLVVTNSGLPYPILVHQGMISRVQAEGLPIGAFPGSRYEEVTLTVAPGDTLVCFTDGITDAHDENGEPFGRERLEEIVALHCGDSSQVLLDAVLGNVASYSWGMPQFDDETLVVIRM